MLREILKLIRNYLRDGEYREWLRVKSACRKAGEGNPVTVTVAGYTLKGNNASSFLHLYEEIFRERAFDTEFKNKSPLIYCCGANIGLEIFFFKKQYPECRIVAFEADPGIAAVLKENIAVNSIKGVELHAAAAWISNGEISFESDGALGGKTGKGKTTVPALRLSEILSRETKIDLLLMDIEGAETTVLSDCRNELPKVDKLFAEWHGPANEKQNLPDFLQLLNHCGFRYRLHNKSGKAPFRNRVVENGFDAMVEIYAER